MLRNREGFTLIELLIVVVIIGILAAIALPKFGQTRERAYVSSMQSDLRNLQTAQEMYYTEHYVYRQASAELAAGTADTELDFQPSQGVFITLDANGLAAGEGFRATATHTAMDAYQCAVTVGGTAGTAQSIACGPTTP